jgi:hypothetical protein
MTHLFEEQTGCLIGQSASEVQVMALSSPLPLVPAISAFIFMIIIYFARFT